MPGPDRAGRLSSTQWELIGWMLAGGVIRSARPPVLARLSAIELLDVEELVDEVLSLAAGYAPVDVDPLQMVDADDRVRLLDLAMWRAGG